MAYRILSNQSEVADYATGLDTKWPVRSEIASHISSQLVNLPAHQPPHIVELCCGPGRLAETILSAHTNIQYTGLDVSPESLQYAQNRVRTHQHRTKFIQADLNADGWWYHIEQPISAILTMQSMHDLGDEAAVARMYRLARQQLPPGGLFVNADLLAYTVDPPGSNPGRLLIRRHLELLCESGYVSQFCTLEKGGFGCIVARTAP